jgi:hypothetical protein
MICKTAPLGAVLLKTLLTADALNRLALKTSCDSILTTGGY